MGDMGQILAQWWHLVVSMVALDLLYWLMSLALHRRNVVAIKMARKGGAFVHRCILFRLTNCS
jgi:hypothetical protein